MAQPSPMVFEDTDDPQVGDLAFHVDGLDARRIVKVDAHGIYLELHVSSAGPFDPANYTFRRRVQ